MYICTYMCIYIYIYIYVYIYVHVYTRTRTHTHAHTRTPSLSLIPPPHIHLHPYTHRWMRTQFSNNSVPTLETPRFGALHRVRDKSENTRNAGQEDSSEQTTSNCTPKKSNDVAHFAKELLDQSDSASDAESAGAKQRTPSAAANMSVPKIEMEVRGNSSGRGAGGRDEGEGGGRRERNVAKP